MINFVFITALSLAVLHNARAICNVCNSNGVACISDNKFQYCVNKVVNTSVTFSCSENEICTTQGRVCINKTLSSAKQACGDKSNCGKCGENEDGKFSCTSRTTFTMCSKGNLTNTRSSCPKDHICDVELSKEFGNPCVPISKERQIEICDLDNAIDAPATPVTPATPATPVTTTTEKIPTPADVFCSQQAANGRFANLDVSMCHNYIICFRKGGAMRSRIGICPNKLYFNPATRSCELAKPVGCT